ncbi:MAG: decaprenyl-phosphate phosphoribosyltransferase [Mycobacteriales bacterium]
MTATVPLTDTVPAARPRAGVAWALVRAGRPRQWLKNLLVVAAPLAAGVLGRPHVAERTAVAVLAFTCAAAGCYLGNDVRDVAADRAHPKKRHRPVASGEVPARAAIAAGLVLVAAAVGLAIAFATWQLAVVILVYVALTGSYTVWLKEVAVIELAIVASGFVLRAIAGAAAARVPVSQWFLIVTSFGALFLVLGKRYAEVTALGGEAAGHRRVLAEYPAAYLRHMRDVAAAVTLLAYCLWAFERAAAIHQRWPFYQLSIVPVTLGLLRYALLLERGQGGAPEDVLLSDRTVAVTALVWAVLFGLGAAHV